MADPRNQYSAHHTDEYGNPTGHGAGTFGNHPAGSNIGATGLHPGVTDVRQEHPGHAGTTTLRRSGSSSSSSSSEDDGQGGRRKKGLKYKIKEKLPGGHKNNPEQGHGGYGTGTTGAYGAGHTGYEPGHAGTGYEPGHAGTGHAGTTDAYGAGHEPGHAGTGHAGTTAAYETGHIEPEKKGFIEKIKEKLPGAGRSEGEVL